MIAFGSCRDVPVPALHEAMAGAFADYVVSMSPALEQFAFMLRQRGYDPSLSQVAIADGRPVAFWIIGSDPQCNGTYVIATGTTPDFRRRGLATQIFAHVRAALIERRAEWLELEVIDENRNARELYERLGFRPRRNVSCFTIPDAPMASASHAPAGIDDIPLSELQSRGPGMRDWPPSWQNGFASLARISDSLVCLGARAAGGLSGYGILIRPTATVAQITVHPNHRRQGVGTRLLMALYSANGSEPVRIINAEARDRAFSAFIRKCNGSEGPRQIVMRMPVRNI